ncbi:hemerythrin HHE cation-binding protein [Aeromicrobium sp. A1-2]|nr:hemerythrin HHE cation-binding protein [Aeromicrobium sp. A1-2]
MLLIHRVVRREIGQLPDQLRAAAGDPARAARLTTHANEMLDFLHTHHTGEDELLWPVLRPRVELESELIDRMEAQHHQIAAAVADVRRDLATWSPTADADVAERMASRLEGVHGVLIEHLAEEESRILPLVSTHFSEEEWGQLGKHGFGAIPGKRRLVILGHILEEADEAERKQFLKLVPPPARVAYRLIGRRQHAKETGAIRN